MEDGHITRTAPTRRGRLKMTRGSESCSRSRSAIFASRVRVEKPGTPFSTDPECCLLPFATASKEKRRKEAERRQTRRQFAAPAGAARTLRARSPVGVHRGSGQGDSWSPRLSIRPCFRETVRSVRSCTAAPTGERRPCASPCMIRKSGCRFSGKIMHHSRALPAPEKRTNDCPRPVSTSHAGHSAGRLMPDAARDRVVSPPAGTALAPLSVLPSAEGVLQ